MHYSHHRHSNRPLMVAGMDRYFQIKPMRRWRLTCWSPAWVYKIDCEMSFAHREDILNMFEGLTHYLFKEMLGLDLGTGSPRWVMMMRWNIMVSTNRILDLVPITELNELARVKAFNVFDSVPYIAGLCVEGKAEAFSNKEIKELTEWVQRPQIGARAWYMSNTIRMAVLNRV